MPHNVTLNGRTADMRAVLDAMPGATSARSPVPPAALIYKVMGKVFAILSLRSVPAVGLKCDPHLGDILREHYEGVGDYRHFLRNWISVALDADVPWEEALSLAAGSYELVCSGLTRKQKAELAALLK